MEIIPDDYRLESMAEQHEIAAGMFVPFTIARLLSTPNANEAILMVQLRGFGQTDETERRLRLRWSAESGSSQPLGVQNNTITEWAALGVACVVIALYTGVRVQEVARQGDCFDYWVTDGEDDFGLEVSGTMSEAVETRHRVKLAQLRANPHGVDGYVVAVNFTTRTVILSFNGFAEADE